MAQASNGRGVSEEVGMVVKVAVLVCLVCVVVYRAWIKGKREADAGAAQKPAIGLNGTLVPPTTRK